MRRDSPSTAALLGGLLLNALPVAAAVGFGVSPRTVMQGGTALRYFRVVDEAGQARPRALVGANLGREPAQTDGEAVVACQCRGRRSARAACLGRRPGSTSVGPGLLASRPFDH